MPVERWGPCLLCMTPARPERVLDSAPHPSTCGNARLLSKCLCASTPLSWLLSSQVTPGPETLSPDVIDTGQRPHMQLGNHIGPAALSLGEQTASLL